MTDHNALLAEAREAMDLLKFSILPWAVGETFDEGPGEEGTTVIPEGASVEDTICECWTGNHNGEANAAMPPSEREWELEEALRNLVAISHHLDLPATQQQPAVKNARAALARETDDD